MLHGNVHMHSTARLSALWLLSKLQGTSGSLRCNVYNSAVFFQHPLYPYTPHSLSSSVFFFYLLPSLPQQHLRPAKLPVRSFSAPWGGFVVGGITYGLIDMLGTWWGVGVAAERQAHYKLHKRRGASFPTTKHTQSGLNLAY
ncbi:hypothetical protein JB92DRAFT_2041863 [Gautieria morchelliformis]|nr:hypothetical protein JB92DRAFT_2041863 [Gautieria morchelliformis]